MLMDKGTRTSSYSNKENPALWAGSESNGFAVWTTRMKSHCDFGLFAKLETSYRYVLVFAKNLCRGY